MPMRLRFASPTLRTTLQNYKSELDTPCHELGTFITSIVFTKK